MKKKSTKAEEVLLTKDKKDRLNEAFEEVRYRRLVSSKKDFAEAIGEDYTSIISAMSGNRATTDKMLSSVWYKYPFFNMMWLSKGEGAMTTDDSSELILTQEQTNVTVVPQNDYMMVEFKDLEQAQGRLYEVKDVENLPEEKRRLVPKEKHKGNYIVVRVNGQSMDDNSKRSICEDDELLIRQYFGDTREMPYRTKLFVVCTKNGSAVRQITKVDEVTGDITCHSFNSLYSDYEIPRAEILQIFTVEKKVNSKIIF